MTSAAIAVLGLLFIKHFICDFVLQTPWQIKQKGIYGAPGGFLHAGLHVAGTFFAIIPLMPSMGVVIALLAAEFVIHYHIDWSKEQMVRRFEWREGAPFWHAIGFDQLMHNLTYLAIVVALTR
jgi:hypothetical protein